VERLIREYELTQVEWILVRDLLPPERQRRKGRPCKDNRSMLNAILWVRNTGSPWRKLPAQYGCWQSAYARFRKWQSDGVMDAVDEILSMFSIPEHYPS